MVIKFGEGRNCRILSRILPFFSEFHLSRSVFWYLWYRQAFRSWNGCWLIFILGFNVTSVVFILGSPNRYHLTTNDDEIWWSGFWRKRRRWAHIYIVHFRPGDPTNPRFRRMKSNLWYTRQDSETTIYPPSSDPVLFRDSSGLNLFHSYF